MSFEAEVYIDGVKLTDAQVTTLRVAVSSFVSDPAELRLLGPVGDSYLVHGRDVEAMLIEGGNRPDRLAARRKQYPHKERP